MADTAYVGWSAVAWVLDEAPGLPASLVSTLVALARHADASGCGAYPSTATLTEYTRKSERQIHRDMRDLLELGLIRLGDQTLVEHLRADRRPTVYDLAIERRRGDVHDLSYTTPRRQAANEAAAKRKERGDVHVRDGVTYTSERGDVHVADGVTYTTPEENIEETKKKPLEETGTQTDFAVSPQSTFSVHGLAVRSQPLVTEPMPAHDVRAYAPPRTASAHTFADDGYGCCAICGLLAGNKRHQWRAA